MNISELVIDSVEYLIEIFNCDDYRHLSFRRDRNISQHNRKNIGCPHCDNNRLLDVDISTVVEIKRLPKNRSLSCQSYIKCRKCHNEVGVNYVM